SQSAPEPLVVRDRANEMRDFSGLSPPGSVALEVIDSRSRPLDARIVIVAGQAPIVEFLGRKTFFTALEPKGRIDVPIAPGEYRCAVPSGGGFLSRPGEIAVSVQPGRTRTAKVVIDRQFDPPARHWYAADLHHHSDRAEAVTPPADLARSQLAAGLD